MASQKKEPQTQIERCSPAKKPIDDLIEEPKHNSTKKKFKLQHKHQPAHEEAVIDHPHVHEQIKPVIKEEVVEKTPEKAPEKTQDSNTLTWAKIASQIDHMTDVVTPKPVKEIKPLPVLTKSADTHKPKKEKLIKEQIPVQVAETPLKKVKPVHEEIKTTTSSWASITESTTDFINAERTIRQDEPVIREEEPTNEPVSSSWADMIDDADEPTSWKEMISEELEIELPQNINNSFNIQKVIETVDKTLPETAEEIKSKPQEPKTQDEKPFSAPLEPLKSLESTPEPIVKPDVTDSESKVTTVESTTVETVTLESTKPEELIPKTIVDEPKKPAYAGLPIDETSNAWMNVIEEPMVLSDEEEEMQTTVTTVETTTTTEEKTTTEKLPQPEEAKPQVQVAEEPKKPAYAGLPIDESSNVWMNIIEEPMVFSDEEEEVQTKTTVVETVTVQETSEKTTTSTEQPTETTAVEIVTLESTKPEELTPEKIAEEPKKPAYEVQTTVTTVETTRTTEEKTTTEKLPQPEEVQPQVQLAEEPKKPAYAGLPIDESSNAWMNVIEEPIVFSDEEEELQTTDTTVETTITTERKTTFVSEQLKESKEEPTEDKPVETITSEKPFTSPLEPLSEKPVAVDEPKESVEKTPENIPQTEEVKPQVQVAEEPKKPVYAGLPIDESSNAWMNVIEEPIVFSDEEEEVQTKTTVVETVTVEETTEKTTISTEQPTVVETVTLEYTKPEELTNEKIVEETKKPAYAGLPIDETSNAWMNVIEEPMVFSDEEEEVQTTVTTITTEENTTTEKLPQPEEVKPQVQLAEEPKKPAYAGLPIDESSNAWMNVIEEPIVFSDEEEELQTTVTTVETTTTPEGKTTFVSEQLKESKEEPTKDKPVKTEPVETTTTASEKPFTSPLEPLSDKPVAVDEPKENVEKTTENIPQIEEVKPQVQVAEEPIKPAYADEEEEVQTTVTTVETTTTTEEKTTTEKLPQLDEVKPQVQIAEEPKKPAYAGLPIDESSNAWMNVIEEPIVFSDEDEEVFQFDETSNAWMNVIEEPMVFSDEERSTNYSYYVETTNNH
ncbi:Zonadhesin [Lucilia cuprina]|nr:Zonadhesin [Lucilia cuprina]